MMISVKPKALALTISVTVLAHYPSKVFQLNSGKD